MVSIEAETPGTTPLAGDSYTLTCTVQVVEGLVVKPVVQWLDPFSNAIVNGSDFTVGNPVTNGTTTTLTLTFNPLHTSHGGRYTCQASVTVNVVSISVSNSTTFDVRLQSKLLVVC